MQKTFKQEAEDAALGPAVIRRLSGIRAFGVGPGIRTGYVWWHERRRRAAYARRNRPAVLAFERQRPVLSPEQTRVVNDLRATGAAHIDITALFRDDSLWRAMAGDAERWLQSEEVRGREEQYLGAARHKGKDYLIRLYGRNVNIPWQTSWLRFAIEPRVLDTVNTYLGLLSKVIYVDLWNTVPLRHAGPDIGSQRWHRDPEDARLVKIFLYLSDVTTGAGPMEYVPNSRAGEKYGHLWPQQFPAGSIPPPDEFDAAIPVADRLLCAHPAGTLLFVDTAGFHRGGRAEHDRRVVATWTFATPASVWPRAFTVPGDAPAFGESARVALLAPDSPVE